MWRKLRYISWFTSAFLAKHKNALFLGGLASFLVFLFAWRYSQTAAAVIFRHKQVIGIVGQYTPATLPRSIQEKISVGLTQVTVTGDVVPAAAESWEIRDNGRTYIFKMKKNILWHDGEEFKATDVNYGFRDADISPINAQILRITLKEPFSPLPSLLSKPLFKNGLQGLGPHRVSRIRFKGQYISEIRLEPLNSQLDHPETIKFYPTLAQAVTAFKLGQIDTLETLEGSNDLLNWGDYITVSKEPNYGQFVAILFNTDRAPFNEKQFRQALAYAISDELTGGQIKSPIPDQYWAYNTALKKISFNETKALELLGEGESATASASFTIHTFTDLLDTAHKLSENWEVLGVETNIKLVNTVPEDFDVFLTILEIPVDPDQYSLWHSIQDDTNLTRYENPKIDLLLEDGRKTVNLSERKEIYDEVQRYLMDELPAIFLSHPIKYTFER